MFWNFEIFFKRFAMFISISTIFVYRIHKLFEDIHILTSIWPDQLNRVYYFDSVCYGAEQVLRLQSQKLVCMHTDYLEVSFYWMSLLAHVLISYRRNVNIFVRKFFKGHLILRVPISNNVLYKVGKLSFLFSLYNLSSHTIGNQLGHSMSDGPSRRTDQITGHTMKNQEH